eukprot:CAMPEP_0168208268 /NCGR_PEP_ID=MMETSP0140_2-20121125/1973_1 /TAXON_ID=44445 /ORGANISM="Pseudo-nitzschia australis, Strain 10249 10 AB" /LENGTH=99 /DNA_ID=CAMNT_0008134645 /DNA_START=623 /DNA_END=920 /DNA_ORIENTATION=+
MAAFYPGVTVPRYIALHEFDGKENSKLTEELPFFDHSDLLATTRLYMTIAFVIPFSILSVLDHGNQQQRWPVPVLMGGTYGFAFGSIAGLIVNNSEAKK